MPPLAERMRPKKLEDFVGQKHILGEGKVLTNAILGGDVPSLIFWGPPGVGKTTLAALIAHTQKRPFIQLSAVSSGVKDVRDAIESAKKQQFFDRPGPILFIDEIHRFNKAQQDALLGAVEKGIITLIGATTENPSFEVISALLSRCHVYVLEHLAREDLEKILMRAVENDHEMTKRAIHLEEIDALLAFSGGDARRLLNLLELVVMQYPEDPVKVRNDIVREVIQKNPILFDKQGDQHYDIASAFIKSIRGSDPNAAVYWLARMIEGGEDVKFIGRRLMISAAEDIGLSNPNALLIATTAFQAVQAVGWPEARIILSEAAIYLACSPKSNSAYTAIDDAQAVVRESGPLPVPLHIRNAPTQLMKQLRYGEGYLYAHAYESNFVDLEFLPSEISGRAFYHPGSNSIELKHLKHLSKLWKGKYGYVQHNDEDSQE